MVHNSSQIRTLYGGTSIDVVNAGNGSVQITVTPPAGSCLHPHTQVFTESGPKFLTDLRPGDTVLTPQGFDTVLGVWESVLGERPVVCVNNKTVVTPGHLWMLEGGEIAAVDVLEYEEQDRNTPRPVKLLSGMKILSGANYEGVRPLQVGDTVLTPSGVEMVESIQCFAVNQAYLPMYSVVLENSHSFFADGLLVATLD